VVAAHGNVGSPVLSKHCAHELPVYLSFIRNFVNCKG
jgi:hypothetical protein